ncbi:head-tail connector protein [Aureimonas altamirensis]|uniref:head-tail connector protein n=1 Tax=Aureimonas altamirensis TaxID=370622 RepID=UPI0025529427|nr:head-tail connector protein [Aureimonas altamirensis]
MLISVDDAKVHLRVDHGEEDFYIGELIEAAEDYVQSMGVATATPFPSAVRHAVLMLVAHFYDNRSAAGEQPSNAIAFGVNALLAPHREHTL